MDNRTPASTQLRDTAKIQENTLEAVNKFKPNSNEYGSTNNEVISEGNGTPIDIQQRNTLEAINYYGANNEYKTPE